MRTAGIKPGDKIIHADVRGNLFYALVESALCKRVGLVQATLRVRPLDRRITHRHVRATEVVGHWRRTAETATRSQGLSRCAGERRDLDA